MFMYTVHCAAARSTYCTCARGTLVALRCLSLLVYCFPALGSLGLLVRRRHPCMLADSRRRNLVNRLKMEPEMTAALSLA